jgi:beta-N-acetylhexosaminidase
MSIESLALRILLPAFPGTTLAPDVAGLLAEGLGGVCLFGSNTADGPEALRALTSAIHAAGPHAVVAVDEEGGDVTRLHTGGGSPVLGPAALGWADDRELTRATGRAVGADLVGVGVDLDLGPVADVNSNPDNPVIGTRSFGADPHHVAAHVAAWLSGLQEAGVSACAKHFPGHGDTAEDSHLAVPAVHADLPTLLASGLVPFAAAVEAGVDTVMTSHIVLPALDPDLPATLSRLVLDLLRERLAFDGVIITDALDMAGASAGRGIPEAAVLSLIAGADLLCIGPDKDVALVREVQAAIVDAVRSGRLAEERLAEAAGRVAALRRVPGAQVGLDEESQLAGARRSLAVDGDLPPLAGAVVVRVDTPANIAVGEVPWGLPADVVIAPDGRAPAGDGPLVVQVRDAHRRPEVVALLGRLAEGRPVVVVEWGWPAPYEGGSPRICTHGFSRPGARAVTELLRRAGWDR